MDLPLHILLYLLQILNIMDTIEVSFIQLEGYDVMSSSGKCYDENKAE